MSGVESRHTRKRQPKEATRNHPGPIPTVSALRKQAPDSAASRSSALPHPLSASQLGDQHGCS